MIITRCLFRPSKFIEIGRTINILHIMYSTDKFPVSMGSQDQDSPDPLKDPISAADRSPKPKVRIQLSFWNLCNSDS
ncbi:Protein of unknown function [Pyronema omphalodes CBS 100304]|uniref:Uncharacterized protein n=1 Tax=Pyronema omphalodes (strain CBS 100304) TaxID=1076935 RepID=U4KTS4_PYROM|nr:Protein of unknown function [Pyronema omphalodes CBS 100304]